MVTVEELEIRLDRLISSIFSYKNSKLNLFDTMCRQVREFSPLKEPEARIYTCGPTVYDYPHIGNLRCFLQEDLLRRWLKLKGYKVVQVMNLTDVDDKTIRASRQKGLSLREYTDIYIKAFFESIELLNLERVEYYPRATDYIPQMVELVKLLLRKGYAYKANDGSIYFSIKKFRSYGKLSGVDLSRVKPGARISQDEYDKDSPTDFALWKAWNPADGEVYWDTELGRGRPGWHLECSVMASTILDLPLDLHGGGVDLIFPHHENEIAQAEAGYDKEFCRHWFHVEHLIVEGQKMSKSLGNTYTIQDIVRRGYDPLALRLFFLQANYKTRQNFTWEALESASKALERLRLSYSRLRELAERSTLSPETFRLLDSEELKGILISIQQAMDNDLNLPNALASVFGFLARIREHIVNEELSPGRAWLYLKLLEKLDRELLGLDVGKPTFERLKLISELNRYERELIKVIEMLINLRSEARELKEWSLADSIRDILSQIGVKLQDTPQGTRYTLEPVFYQLSLERKLRAIQNGLKRVKTAVIDSPQRRS